MLLGSTTGALIGGAADADRAASTQLTLTQFPRALTAGSTALVAEVVELSPGPLDAAMTQLGGTVLRRPAEEVLAELEATDAALRVGQEKADQRMREKRRTEIKEGYEQRKSALLASLKRP